MYQFLLEASISVRLSPLISHGWRAHIGASVIRAGCIPGTYPLPAGVAQSLRDILQIKRVLDVDHFSDF